MASNLESAAAFAARAREIGLDDAVIDLLNRNGVSSFGSLAFITAYRPGQADEQPFLTALRTVLGREPSNPELIILRRLFFESCTLSISELTQRAQRDDATEPARMPVAERNARITEQKHRLVGIHFSPETEPSHKLVDLVVQMGVDQNLEWLPWEKLTNRAAEITHSQKDFKLSFDAQGALKVAQKFADPEASVTGDTKVRQALNRRARAFDLAKICGYVKMEEWHERIFELLSREPAPNAMPISLRQIKEADKALFRKLAEKTRGRLTIQPDGTKPMESVFDECMNHAEVQFCTIPMVKVQTVGQSPKEPKGRGKGKDKDGKGRVGNDFLKDQPTPSLPPGCSQMTPENKPICNLFNRGKCTFAKEGKRCRRGFHVCWKCFKPKPFHSCNHS